MSGSSIEFFGDEEDLSILFEQFDKTMSFKYTQMLSDLNQQPKEYKNATSLLKYLVTHSSPIKTHSFLISDLTDNLVGREIKMKDGSGKKINTDQNYNKNTVEILLGGHAAETTLVTTVIRTTGETQKSKDMFKMYKKLLVANSKRVKSFYVLKNAFDKLNNGWRLTQSINYSRKIDLVNS